MADYLRPTSLDEALQALARPWTVLAGGTDFYPARVGRAIDENVLDIGGIGALARHHGGTGRLAARRDDDMVGAARSRRCRRCSTG